MKTIVTFLALVLSAIIAHSQPVVSGLVAEFKTVQEKRLERCPQTTEKIDEVRTLMEDWAEIALSQNGSNVTFIVSDCEEYGFTTTGANHETIVISYKVAYLPKSERQFVISHELGHVINNDVSEIMNIVADENVAKIEADDVYDVISQQISLASHRHEYAADAFAVKTINALGGNGNEAIVRFFSKNESHDSLSHPSSTKRSAVYREN